MSTAERTTESVSIRPTRIQLPQADLDDLRDRLHRTRWAPDIPGTGWERGVPTGYLRKVADHWADGFDWRTHENALNQHPQYATTIDGAHIHFLHIRSPRADAVPLLLLHGWPTTVLDFLDLIGPLTDPGASARTPAFHLVIPSLPGYGFSGPLPGPGWTDGRTAAALADLMSRLGYDRYGVHGGDVGAFIAPLIARSRPDHVIGVHVNGLLTFPTGDPATMAALTDTERARLEGMKHWQDRLGAYMQLQGTRPQTIAAALHDSPAGQLAWIIEKFKDWTDPAFDLPEDAVDLDRVLATVTVYWLTATAGSAAHTYYERFNDPSMWRPLERGTVPTGVAVFTTDFSIRPFAEATHTITHWTEHDHGGHFPALETPELLIDDIRAFFHGLS
ncbi:epoxide hydrolase family protein [Actinocorallia sp. B10E7]|uniref:epoxide hydrolase family protein n=1 Tax=Actinocorallia sp. B10E7 TaxID=3153558 RepID=UPI00325CB701